MADPVQAAAAAAADTALAINVAQEAAIATIESAETRIAAAERTAEDIAAAAMESERGREISALREDVYNCREELRNLSSSSAQLAERVTALQASLDLLLALPMILAALAPPTPEPVSSGLIPNSLAEETTVAAETLDPANLAAVAESPAPAIAPVRRLKIRL
jgi:chromosome segregation ATPase